MLGDPPERRLTPEQALDRQLAREQRAAGGRGWRAEAVVYLDRLIDETWIDGKRQKRRWTLKAAEAAVRGTVPGTLPAAPPVGRVRQTLPLPRVGLVQPPLQLLRRITGVRPTLSTKPCDSPG